MPERRITREKKYRFIRLFFEKGLVLKGFVKLSIYHKER